MINHILNIPIKSINMNKTILITIINHPNHSLSPSLNTLLQKYKKMINSPNLSIKTESHSKKTKNSKDHQSTKTLHNNISIKLSINANKKLNQETCLQESEIKASKETSIPVVNKSDKQMHSKNTTIGAEEITLANQE